MAEKPTKNEDEFFAREEAEKLHRLHAEKRRAQTQQQAEEEKKAHWMRCGKCGYELHTIRWRNVDIEKCFRCGAVLLDEGELEKLAGSESSGQLVSTFLDLFSAKSGRK